VLTAVDAAVMVIDAAKGVEAQTIKLLEVCRLRNTPIITFVNKLDREVREPFDLLEEIESVLKIDCAPVTWPLGMGKHFRGVYHLLHDQLLRFTPGEERLSREAEKIEGSTTRAWTSCFPTRRRRCAHDVELLRGASHPFDMEKFLAGSRRRCSSAPASTTSACRRSCRRWSKWAPPPQPRDGGRPPGATAEAPFTGFVFKIQANMDPKHRDRIAFFRVCSGRYTPGMKVWHQRMAAR
jgi:peptide chain release factor 3